MELYDTACLSFIPIIWVINSASQKPHQVKSSWFIHIQLIPSSPTAPTVTLENGRGVCISG